MMHVWHAKTSTVGGAARDLCHGIHGPAAEEESSEGSSVGLEEVPNPPPDCPHDPISAHPSGPRGGGASRAPPAGHQSGLAAVGELFHPTARAAMAVGPAQAAVAGKQLTPLQQPAIVNPRPPSTMPHARGAEGVKGYPVVAGDESLEAGCGGKNEGNRALFLDRSAQEVFDELPMRGSQRGTPSSTPRMVIGHSEGSSRASVQAQVLSTHLPRDVSSTACRASPAAVQTALQAPAAAQAALQAPAAAIAVRLEAAHSPGVPPAQEHPSPGILLSRFSKTGADGYFRDGCCIGDR